MTDTPRPPWPASTRRLRIDGLQVDLCYRRVLRDDQTVELPQRMFDLLLLFLAEPQVLHTRADLFRRLWPGVVVEDANLSQSVWMLRKALGPARKDWIRTVAKSGYVFEPPASVEALVVAAAPCAVEPVAAIETAHTDNGAVAAGAAPASPMTVRPARRRWLVATAVAAGLAVLVGSIALLRPRAGTTAPPALTVALVEVDDRALARDQRWPGTLLRAWLEWKLSSLPEVTLSTDAHLAVDASAPLPAAAPTIVLLASGPSAGAPGEVYLRARFDTPAGAQQLELTGPQARIPAMVDTLSRQVLAKLLPRRAHERWPALDLDAAAARRYSAAFETYKRRDWAASASALRASLARAPRFGLARLQLATALARLGQSGAAIRQMKAARALLRPLPDDAATVLDAAQLSLDPRQTMQAANAYAALARRYPQRSSFALDQARMLAHSDQPVAARAILSQAHWARKPVAVRLSQLLNLAEVDMALGDPEAARTHARKAEQLAVAAGSGWSLERGHALLLLADAELFQHRDQADTSLYDQAAAQFTAGGSHLNAAYARFLGETARPPTGELTQLDALLARTRAEGYYRIEVDILRRVAYQHYLAGEQDQYRKRLEQALAAANAAGDTVGQQLLDLDLLNEDMLRGDLDSADTRIRRLRDAGLAGDTALWVDQFEASAAGARGRYAQALAALDRGGPAAPGGAAKPRLSAARTACLRADLLLLRGELSRARSQSTQCGAPDEPYLRLQGKLGHAAADLFAGDRVSAVARVHAAQDSATIPPGPDRWMFDLQVAALLTRAGELADASALYAKTLPAVRRAGYGWLQAQVETGLAEIAAARGEWRASRAHAAAARQQPSTTAWVLRNRLAQVDIASALAAGDRRRAEALLADADAEAHQLGDAVAQLEIHSLMSPDATLADCSHATRMPLVAETGLRGATLDWLVGPLKTGATPRLATTRPRR